MRLQRTLLLMMFWLCAAVQAQTSGQISEQVVDIPTRDGVTQRFIYLRPPQPVATVILFTGGQGGLQIFPNGSMGRGEGNFLVRSRRLFADSGLAVAVVDAPSDHQTPPFLGGFRQQPEHVRDIQAVMVWLRAQAAIPLWLVGTSRGTQSAAFLASRLPVDKGGPDGLVLTSTILRDNSGRAVPQMALQNIRIPVLVVHHEQDGCKLCPFGEVPAMLNQLSAAPRKEVISFSGGLNQGDPCEAKAYHGYNGIEPAVVKSIADWIKAVPTS